MKINHLLILRKQSKERNRQCSPPPENIEVPEPGPSPIRQQEESASHDSAATDTEQEAEMTEGEMTTLYKFLSFYKNATRILWRVAEIHAVKVVSFVIMLVVVQQVSTAYILLQCILS